MGKINFAEDFKWGNVRRASGVWDQLLDAVSEAYDGDIVMIDSSCVYVHQHGVGAHEGDLKILAWDSPAAG